MSEPSLLLETIIRGIAAGLYLATAIVIARSLRTPSRISGSLSYVSKMAHVIAQFPPAVGPLGLWYLVVDLPSVIGASLTWIFVTEFFQESRKFDWRKIIPLAVVLINAIVAKLSPPDIARPLWLFHNFITVGLMFHVLVVVVRSWSSDLVERRRLIVTPLYIFASLYSIGVAFVQTMELFTFAPRQPSLFAAFTLLGSSLLGIIVFGQAGPELFGQPKTAQPNSQTRNEPVAPLTPAEKSLAAQLDRLMRVERLYRTPNLRISFLAQQLRVPEHRLRHLLNQGLGYRNFNAFVGQWRIDEARDALADPEQAPVPISTIAIDSGFQSLAPFNRAFKRETGLTPTEFRTRALGALAAKSGDA
jgi:AraC-like DNA-binding protein